jgi:hypothetical protein
MKIFSGFLGRLGELRFDGKTVRIHSRMTRSGWHRHAPPGSPGFPPFRVIDDFILGSPEAHPPTDAGPFPTSFPLGRFGFNLSAEVG